jgi:hypothetical protein
MPYTFTVEDCEMKLFIGMLSKHPRFVAPIMIKAGMTWENYWNIPEGARPPFVYAMRYSENLPTIEQARRILAEEKRQGALTNMLKWADTESMWSNIVVKAVALLEYKQATKLLKQNGWVNACTVVENCNKGFLPLFMSEISNKKGLWRKEILLSTIAERLKE